MYESRKGLHPATVVVLILTVVFVTLNIFIMATNVQQLVTVGSANRTSENLTLPSGAAYDCFRCTYPEAVWIRWFYQGERLEIPGEFPSEIQAGYRYYRVKGMDPADAMVVEKAREVIVVHPNYR